MRNMRIFLATITILLCSIAANAKVLITHDFEVDGIFYKKSIFNKEEVEVTFKGEDSDSYSNEYSGEVNIPSTVTYNDVTYRVTSIGQKAFRECTELISVNIEANITTIESEAFYRCANLTHINIPSSTISIGATAFFGCSSLESVIIPEDLNEIGNSAFSDCSSLVVVNIPDQSKLTKVSFNAFYKTPWYNNLHDGVVYLGKVLYGYKGTMPENTTVEVKEGIETIEGAALRDCRGLVDINIPKSVKRIGTNALKGTAWLDNQPDGVVYVGTFLYQYKGTMPENTSVDIRKGTTGIADNAFAGCRNLTSVSLPEGIENIGEYAFYNCEALTAITMPNSIVNIGMHAFWGLTSLKEVTIGTGLVELPAYLFSSSKSIEKICIYHTTPPLMDKSCFPNAIYQVATLYVPKGCALEYQTATGWSGFCNIAEFEEAVSSYLTIRQADNGEVGISVDLGRSYSVRIAAAEGWEIHSVTLDGVDVTNQLDENYTFTIPALTSSAVLNVAYEQTLNKIGETYGQYIKVCGHEGVIYVDGTKQGDRIAIYTPNGTTITEIRAEGANTQVIVERGQLYMVQVIDKVVKILM